MYSFYSILKFICLQHCYDSGLLYCSLEGTECSSLCPLIFTPFALASFCSFTQQHLDICCSLCLDFSSQHQPPPVCQVSAPQFPPQTSERTFTTLSKPCAAPVPCQVTSLFCPQCVTHYILFLLCMTDPDTSSRTFSD